MTEAPRAAAGGRAPARPHWAVFIGLAATIVVADQLLKAWILANFSVGVPSSIVGDYARITLTQNTGALFGMFRDQAGIFAIFSIAVIGIILAMQARTGRSLYLSVALGLLLGGALGNLADRIRLGYVVDFVDMGIGAWRFYTYNIADSAITVSILLLLLVGLWPALARRVDDA